MNKSDDVADVDEMIMHAIQNWLTTRFENGKSIKDILKPLVIIIVNQTCLMILCCNKTRTVRK